MQSKHPLAQGGWDPVEVFAEEVVSILLGSGEFRRGREEEWEGEKTAGEPLSIGATHSGSMVDLDMLLPNGERMAILLLF